jgi:hypothetical protein
MNLPTTATLVMVLSMALIITSVSAGNGIDLNGAHYNLNLIGMKNPKEIPIIEDDSHVIFVKMGKDELVQTRIYLKQAPEGQSFKVIDGDGTDGTARFQLPLPYPEGTDVNLTSACASSYQIYVRVLGKPGGTGNITPGLCTSDGNLTTPICNETAGSVWFSTEHVDLTSHSKGSNQKFVQVTHNLTTIEVGGAHYGLFSNTLYGDLYFWELFNNGMKLIQVRFYPTPLGYCETTSGS